MMLYTKKRTASNEDNMKRSVLLLGATTAGFVGVVGLHGAVGGGNTLTSGGALPSIATSATTPTTPTTPTVTTPPSPSGAASSMATAVGQNENYGYGQMSVQVTVANHRIIDVSVHSIHALESYSMQLEQQVVPILKSEVLQAQGTKISALSGATYTSEAYAYSLQSALDKLHFK